MKPFSAWLAMESNGILPMEWKGRRTGHGQYYKFEAFKDFGDASEAGNGPSRSVLIIEDTGENRRKLGMEE